MYSIYGQILCMLLKYHISNYYMKKIMYMKTKTLIHHHNKVTMQVFNWPLLRYINYIPPLTQSKYIFTQRKKYHNGLL